LKVRNINFPTGRIVMPESGTIYDTGNRRRLLSLQETAAAAAAWPPSHSGFFFFFFYFFIFFFFFLFFSFFFFFFCPGLNFFDVMRKVCSCGRPGGREGRGWLLLRPSARRRPGRTSFSSVPQSHWDHWSCLQRKKREKRAKVGGKRRITISDPVFSLVGH
jgi:hypothetical protein